MKKAEHLLDAFELWCWRRLLRVPWTARRSNQSILKEISPGISLEGLTLCDSVDCSLPGYSVCGIFQARLLESESENEVTQSCPTLCNPMDCSLLRFSVHGFSRQEYWNGLPFPSPRDIPNPGIEPGSPAL